MRRHHWIISLAALLALTPTVLHGPSCGKDLIFHVQSWLGAADQLRHGTLWPRWDAIAAYNAGEPRFVFYPPLSWTLGGLLTLILPFAAVPYAVAWIAMSAAGLAMHHLARRYTSPTASLLAACLYLANPFLLFSLLARSAFGELFAAAFCPWLLAAALEEKPRAHRIALPLGLIWLSNIPGAVLCTYLLGFVLAYRLLQRQQLRARASLVFTTALGLIFALALDALSILPAIAQRSSIQISGAFPIGLRPIDNLLFHRTLPSDPLFVQISHLAAYLLTFTLTLLLLRGRRATPLRPFLLSLTAAIGVSLTFLATPLWQHAPALFLVQFPWRTLFILATIGSLAAALTSDRMPLPRRSGPLPLLLAPALSLVLSALATRAYHVPCGVLDTPASLKTAFLDNRRNLEPTDEYVVANADPEAMHQANPPFWLATSPTDDAPPSSQLTATPLHFAVAPTAPGYLILNLQNYPNWRITANDREMPHLTRPDGLLAIALPPGPAQIDIRWRHTPDEIAGCVISLAAWLLLSSLNLCPKRWHRRRTAGEPTSNTRAAASDGTLSQVI